jgi:hypothetical protein
MFDTILKYILYNLLIGVSITTGFVLTSIYINHINREANLEEFSDEEETISIYSYLDDIEDEPMSELSEDSLLKLKEKFFVLNLDPLLKQTVRMYYEREQDAFCYYSERETIYKYLDIVARGYVLEHHCKQLYVELGESEEKVLEDNKEVVGPFVSKKNTKKKVYEKKLIRFIYKGNENDYQSLQPKVTNMCNDINILDFLKMQRKGEDSDEYEKITKEE